MNTKTAWTTLARLLHIQMGICIDWIKLSPGIQGISFIFIPNIRNGGAYNYWVDAKLTSFHTSANQNLATYLLKLPLWFFLCFRKKNPSLGEYAWLFYTLYIMLFHMEKGSTCLQAFGDPEKLRWRNSRWTTGWATMNNEVNNRQPHQLTTKDGEIYHILSLKLHSLRVSN